MTYEQKRATSAGWTGDLNDDCFLSRYGLYAHVEKMGRGVWWFSIANSNSAPSRDLFNSADCQTMMPLTSGAKARCAAECLMEHMLAAAPPTEAQQDEKQRIIGIVMAEYAYWRNVESNDSISAMGALSNVIAAIGGHKPTHHTDSAEVTDLNLYTSSQGELAPQDELARLEREIAMKAAITRLKRNRYTLGILAGWSRLDGDIYEQYLDHFGLIERHPTNKNLVRVREQS